MSIIQEYINFERGIDPKKSMRVGLVQKWLSLKKGDILKIIKDFTTDSQDQITDDSHYHVFPKGDYLQINMDLELYDDGCIGFTAYLGDKSTRSVDDIFIWGTPLQLEENLVLVPRIQEAQNFTRGMEPKKAMEIGKYTRPYKKGDRVKVWIPNEKRLVELRINEDEDTDSNGNPITKTMLSNKKPAWKVRRIWVRYLGEIRTANYAIQPENPGEDRWIMHQ